MPDISMCGSRKCVDRMECYRYRAIPSEYQYYFLPQAYQEKDCESKWEIDGERCRSVETLEKMEKEAEDYANKSK